MPSIKNPTSAKHGWVVGSQLLQPFPISNPPLLQVGSGAPLDLTIMRGRWVLVVIGPLSYSPANYGLGDGANTFGYSKAVRRHFEDAGLEAPHSSIWRLDDIRGYESRSFRKFEHVRESSSVGHHSLAVTSFYLNGAGNTYNRLFMQWIQRTEQMAFSNRDTSRDRVVDPYDRLGHPKETYPIAILIDPEGFVQGYWRGLLPGSYTLYRTIRDMQEKYAAAKEAQAIIDGTASAMQEVTKND
jgi:hypothetical protein